MYSIEIERPTTKELFEAAAGYGFTKMQFDFPPYVTSRCRRP